MELVRDAKEEAVFKQALRASDFKDKSKPTRDEMMKVTKRLKSEGLEYPTIARLLLYHEVGPVQDPDTSKKGP